MGDNDFPAVMANWGRAKDMSEEWITRSQGDTTYIESGTGIPTRGYQESYQSGDSHIEDPWLVGHKKVF